MEHRLRHNGYLEHQTLHKKHAQKKKNFDVLAMLLAKLFLLSNSREGSTPYLAVSASLHDMISLLYSINLKSSHSASLGPILAP